MSKEGGGPLCSVDYDPSRRSLCLKVSAEETNEPLGQKRSVPFCPFKSFCESTGANLNKVCMDILVFFTDSVPLKDPEAKKEIIKISYCITKQGFPMLNIWNPWIGL